MKLEYIDKIFRDYVFSFDMSDNNISLKYYHTLEVAYITTLIAKKMKLNEEEIYLAQVIAYLHDIGRFEQIVNTNTFSDMVSDHADNGVKLLFERGLIERFEIDKKYYPIIEKAVRNHNKYEVLDECNEKERLFVDLIRDSDKIDIYRVRINQKIDYFDGCPDRVNLDDFYNFKSINLKNKKNKYDAILCVISFIFDINYKESIEVLNELGHYERFLNNIIVSSDMKDLFLSINKKVHNYLHSKI